MPAALKAAVIAKCKAAVDRRHPNGYSPGPLPVHVPQARGGDGATTDELIRRMEIDQGIAEGERRVAAKANPQASALCAAKEDSIPATPKPASEKRVILGGAQSPDQPKRHSKRDLRHVMTTIAERQRKFADETGFDLFTHKMVQPPMEQWDRPEAMPLYWRLMVAGDATPPLSALSPADQDMARWLHDEELCTITGDDIRCLSDARDVEQRRYPGSPLLDPCHRKDGKCTFHTSGPCPKVAFTGGPYHAGIGQYLGPERSARLILDAWSAIQAGHPCAQIGATDRHDMTRPGGIRISLYRICEQANARLAQLKALHPGEWAGYRYMSTDVCERTVKALLESGELTEEEKPYLTRIGHTDVGIPRTYAADDMAGWTAYANAGNPRKRRLKVPRWLRRRDLQEAA